MSPQSDDDAAADRVRSVVSGGYSAEVRDSQYVQIGEGNTQIINIHGATWTDGVAPPPLTGVGETVESPYRGLGAFEERDADFFFGRETAAEEVRERLSRLASGTGPPGSLGLLVISGVSGAGKSSLLRAGVLPLLREEGLAARPGAGTWPCLVLVPGRAPLDELAVRVALLAGADAASVRRGLEADPAGFALTARQASLARSGSGGETGETGGPASEDRQLLLVVDQFEQVFTQCQDEGERQAFISALCSAAGPGRGSGGRASALVVLGVRADFESRCVLYPELANAIQHRYLVAPMTERQLRMAITGPAKKAGSHVDNDLTDSLLAEVRTRRSGGPRAGVLPLLSHALDQAWRSRVGATGPLALVDYERVGGIEGAVAASAERAYTRLTPGQREAARQVFTRLTTTSPDDVDTAGRSSKKELAEGKNAAQSADVDAVLEAFAAERLLTLAADSVEISHEALLTAWPLLRDTWLAETRADRAALTQLRTAAASWADHDRDPAYLYRGTLLLTADSVAARVSSDSRRALPLSHSERDFLQASGRARRRATLLRRSMTAVLAALTLISAIVAGLAVHDDGLAVHNAQLAAQQRAIALSRQLAASAQVQLQGGDGMVAGQLAVAAWSVSPTQQAENAIVAILTEQQSTSTLLVSDVTVTAVAISSDGKFLATGDSGGTIQLWNLATGARVGPPLQAGTSDGDGVGWLAFSRNGKLLVTADSSSIAQLWNVVTARPVGPSFNADPDEYGELTGLAFSPDRMLIAAAESAGAIELWNPVTGRPVCAPFNADADSGVNGIAFSPNGRLLAAAGQDGTAQMWNLATGEQASPPMQVSTRSLDWVTQVAFSPNGEILATGDQDGTVKLWDTATGQALGTPFNSGAGNASGVTGIAFSPSGALIAIADKGTVQLRRVSTGKQVRLDASGKEVGQVAFSPSGDILATAEDDGTVQLWDTATGQPANAPFPVSTSGRDAVTSMAFSPDGKIFATTDADGTVYLRNATTHQPVGKPLNADPGGWGGGVSGMAFSPDGKVFATVLFDGSIQLWDTTTLLRVGKPVQAGIKSDVTGIAFSPSDNTIAVSGILDTSDITDNAGSVNLLDIATGKPTGKPIAVDSDGTGVEGQEAAFSPSGKILATANYDGTIRLWNTATSLPAGDPIRMDTATEPGVLGVAFSSGSKLLAATSADSVELWNAVTDKPVGEPFPMDIGFADSISSPKIQLLRGGELAFSPNGTALAVAYGKGNVQLWPTSVFTHSCGTLRSFAGTPSRQTWNKYAPGSQFPSHFCS